MKFWMRLIAILVLINYSGCAIAPKPVPVANKQSYPTYDDEVVSQMDVMQEVDPENPPKDGVWMTWDGAHKLASHLRNERLDMEIKIIELEKERDVANARYRVTDKALQEANKSKESWWNRYGFVIGIASGLAAGVAATIGAGAKR